MDSTGSKSKRVKVEPDQPHHIHLVEEDTDNEENVVNNDCQTGQHMHHHHHFHYHHHHYHHHDNNEPTPTLPPPPPINVPVRIHLKIESANKFLAVINFKLALVSSNTDDNRQYWEIRRDKIIKDETGQPAFALVNKSTGLAMRGSASYGVNKSPAHIAAYVHLRAINPRPVDLVAYHPEGAIGAGYGSQLWVHGVDKPGFGGYKFLSPHDNSRFNLDGSCPTNIVTSPSIGGVYQRWKFLVD